MSSKKFHVFNGFSGDTTFCGKNAMYNFPRTFLASCISITQFKAKPFTERCKSCETHLDNIVEFFSGAVLSPEKVKIAANDLGTLDGLKEIMTLGDDYRELIKNIMRIDKKKSKKKGASRGRK